MDSVQYSIVFWSDIVEEDMEVKLKNVDNGYGSISFEIDYDKSEKLAPHYFMELLDSDKRFDMVIKEKRNEFTVTANYYDCFKACTTILGNIKRYEVMWYIQHLDIPTINNDRDGVTVF